MGSHDDLGKRIERLVVDPDSIDVPVVRLMRPFLATLGFTPKVAIVRVSELLDHLKVAAGTSVEKPAREELANRLALATKELEANVLSVERATVIGKRPLVSHAAWLRRLYEVVVRAERAIAAPSDTVALDTASAVDPVRLLPPLAVRGVDAAAKDPADSDPHAANLVSVELGAIDHLLAAANEEGELLGRRRRLLEAARQMLLESSAAVSLDASGVDARRKYLAKEIGRVDRLQAAGLAPDVALTHQLREALARGERQRLHAAVVAMQGPALARGDHQTARLTRLAMTALWKQADCRSNNARAASARRSADDLFGVGFGKRIDAAYEKGRAHYATLGATDDLRETADTYLTDGGVLETTSAAVMVDGCFETGGALVPMRVIEHETRARAVRYPTSDLVLLPATGPDEIADAVIDDPRRIMLDLAAGRLLARRFVLQEVIDEPRAVMQGEVRVYVLDGSGSMIGPRARVRDALLVAELASIKQRCLEHAKGTRVVLFFRYFDTSIGPLTRVTNSEEADAAMVEVLATVRTGGTDIQAALLSSIHVMRDAKAKDADLSRGHIVLVTDGESPVDGATVIAARAALGMPVGLSVIALGQENQALREIVVQQRARGERAFYHFVSDEMLSVMVRGELDDGPAIHLPAVSSDDDTPEQLALAVGAVVDEMAALARAREVEAMEALDSRSAAEAELGLAEGESLSQGERARAYALHRDRMSLVTQFDRWFPPPNAEIHGATETEDAEAVTVVLATIAEILDVVSGSDLARRADAIDMLERLLPDSRLSPARWTEVVGQCTSQVAAGLFAVRKAANA